MSWLESNFRTLSLAHNRRSPAPLTLFLKMILRPFPLGTPLGRARACRLNRVITAAPLPAEPDAAPPPPAAAAGGTVSGEEQPDREAASCRPHWRHALPGWAPSAAGSESRQRAQPAPGPPARLAPARVDAMAVPAVAAKMAADEVAVMVLLLAMLLEETGVRNLNGNATDHIPYIFSVLKFKSSGCALCWVCSAHQLIVHFATIGNVYDAAYTMPYL